MSKLKRLLGALSLVSLFIFSSCVDDSVAPEVTALRQAQVDLLNADIAFREAQTALQTAQAEAQSILNAFNSANNTILLASNQADLDKKLADLEVELAKAEVMLLQQELEIEKAIDDLERYIATAGLDDAAYYLAQWRTVMFGGAMAGDVADGTGIVVTSGIINLQKEIAGLKRDVAVGDLLLTADEATRQAYADAKTAAALTAAQTALANAVEALAMQQALLVTYADEDAYAAQAIIEEQLLALIEDSIAAYAAAEAAQAAFNNAGGAVTAAANYVDWFDMNIDIAANFPNSGHPGYKASYADSIEAAEFLAAYESDKAAWLAYADSLQAVHDDLYPLYAEALEAELADLAADTLAAWEDTQGVSDNIVDNNQIAFAAYMVAYNNLIDLSNLAGYTLTRTDSQTVVDAREDWDGMNVATMFAGTDSYGDPFVIDAEFGTSMTPADATDGATLNDDGETGIGGTLKILFDAQGGNAQVAYQEAVIRYENAAEQYDATVDLFAELAAYIASVDAGKENTGTFVPTVMPVVDALSTLEGIRFYQTLLASVADLDEDLQDALSAVADLDDACDVFVAAFPRADKPEECSTSDDLDGSELSSTAKEAFDGVKTWTTASTNANEALAHAQEVLAEWLPDYLAALALLDLDHDAVDAADVARIALLIENNAAQAAAAAVSTAIADLQADYLDVFTTLITIDPTDGSYVTTTFKELYEEAEDNIAALDGSGPGTADFPDSIEDLEDAVEEAEVDVLLAAEDVLEAADLLEADKAELAGKETELSVLQSLADALQALLTAALAG